MGVENFKCNHSQKVGTKILGGNNKIVTHPAACPISDLYGKEEQTVDSVFALSNIGSLLPNKSDIEHQPRK